MTISCMAANGGGSERSFAGDPDGDNRCFDCDPNDAPHRLPAACEKRRVAADPDMSVDASALTELIVTVARACTAH